ncbi:HNH endonuclease [Lacimicrobium sp. SS2-24]
MESPSYCRVGKGGSDKLSNLVLLHPNCHRQLHANSC